MPDVPTLNGTYLVLATTVDVTVEIKIGGPGQTSRTTGELSGSIKKVIFKDIPGSISETIVGPNNTLDNSTLDIDSIVAATSSASNYCEMLVLLKGGKEDKTYTLYQTVAAQGDNAVFSCSIDFVQV